MALYSRIEVVTTMKNHGIIPVFYNGDIEVCKQVIKSCYDGGARVFEFTNRGDGAHKVYEEISYFVTQELPEMVLGAGSIVDAGTTALYLQLGANFIVSPIVNPEMAKVCNRRKIAWMPGCGSVTEISYAEELGAEIIKIFPAMEVGGPSFVKAVKGPFPWTSIMPTGGVSPTEENLRAWFEAGVHCVGIGSKLFLKNQDGSYDYKGITEKVRSAFQILKQIKK